MKENRISIRVNQPVEVLYAFTTNPANTNKWIEYLTEETASDFPPQIGTVYKNHNGSGVWDEYIVSDLIENQVFELTSKDGTYQVRYTYIPISSSESEMEYFEWMNQGELTNPLDIKVLEKLKEVVELV